MSTYYFTQDHYIGGILYLAGTVASTTDVGGTLPANWVPTGNVDPLDTPAVNAMHAAPPSEPGLARQQWSTIAVAPPVTYWRRTPIPGSTTSSWTLTGLGASLPAVNG